MKIGSLFSGYGGLDLAVEEILGGEVAWFCEWDEAPAKILEKRFPGIPNYRDVSQVDWASVPKVDVLTGGFPCQDVSLAGRRAGLAAGTRSGLWSEFAKAISVIKPEMVVIENVRGLLSAKADSDMEQCAWCMGETGDGEPVLRALGAVLGELAELGYDAEWEGVRASEAGAPHQRFRVFILAWRRERERERERVSVPTPTANDGSFENMRRKISETSVNRGVGLHTWAHRINDGFYEVPEDSLLRTVSAIEGEGGAMSEKKSREQRRMLQVRDQMAELAAQNGLKVSKAISDSLLPTPNTMDHLPARDESKIDRSKGGYSNVRETVVRMNFGRFTPAIERWEKVIDRKAPDPTKPDGKEGTHRLSSKFTEWMMGLPEGWITDVGLDRKEELRACGNGVVPQQAALALRLLLDRKGSK